MKYRFLSRREFIDIFLKSSAVACLPGCAATTSDGSVDSNQPSIPDVTHSTETENPDEAHTEGIDDSNPQQPQTQNGQPLQYDDKPAIIWLQAQDCAGCSESLFSSFDTDYSKLIVDDVCLRYHETLMFGSGDVSNYVLQQAIAEGGYLLIVEGAFPGSDKRFLRINGEPLETIFISASRNAAFVFAIGSCAAFGAVPKLGTPCGRSVGDLLETHRLTKPLINIPGCPAHPLWLLDTINAVLSGNTPPLDDHLRPLKHFSQTIHEQCPRREFNDKGRFVLDWNNPVQRRWCLYNKGCKGQDTYADCPKVLWNGNANWCIATNAPCSGCTEPQFCGNEFSIYSNDIT